VRNTALDVPETPEMASSGDLIGEIEEGKADRQNCVAEQELYTKVEMEEKRVRFETEEDGLGEFEDLAL